MVKKKIEIAALDAVEAGRLTKQGGARVALLCARSVRQGPKTVEDGKMSVKEFAASGNFSSRSGTILKNLRAWDSFAEANGLPQSQDLVPGQEVEFDAVAMDWESHRPRADAGSDYRVDDPDAYAEAAAAAGTTKSMAIRVGSNKAAIRAAMKADPKVREVMAEVIREDVNARLAAQQAIEEAHDDWTDKNRAGSEADEKRRRANHSAEYFKIESKLGQIVARYRESLDIAEGVEFSAEESEFLRHSLGKIRAVAGLLDLKISGEVNVDWDSEFQKITS